MSREEAISKAINIVRYCEAHFAKSKEAREDAANIIEALEQEPCDDWFDVPSDEMTLEQARAAVKDLRKALVIEKGAYNALVKNVQCEDAVSRQAVLDIIQNSLGMTINRITTAINQLPPVVRENSQDVPDTNVGNIDYISRQAVEDAIYDYSRSCDVNFGQIMEYIEKIPPVVRENKTGQWSHDGSHWENRFICSKCGYKLFGEQLDSCPICGQPKMQEVKDE